MGYSKKDAEKKADSRIKTEKILLGLAGASITIGAAYAANKVYKNKIDKVIKTGHNFQRIEFDKDSSNKLHDVFYTSGNKHDDKRYYGFLGNTRIQQHGKAYTMKLKSNDSIKVASRDNAIKIFKNLYEKDKTFSDDARIYIYDGKNKINFEKPSYKKMYENFNVNIVNMDTTQGRKIRDTFISELKKNGYDAIQDINDIKYSGYNAKNPLIVFNKNKISISSMKEINKNDVMNAHLNEQIKKSMEDIGKEYALKTGLIVGSGSTAATIATRNMDSKTYEKHKKKMKDYMDYI